MPKNCKKKYFFVLNKYQSVTHVYTYIFQGLFKSMVTSFTKHSLNYYSLKVKNFAVIVLKMRVLGQKNFRGCQTVNIPVSQLQNFHPSEGGW